MAQNTNLKQIIKASLFTPITGGRWGLPLLFWGEPGIGKTSLLEEVCGEYGLPCETLSPSERGEGAFGVVPVPGHDEAGLAAAMELVKKLGSRASDADLAADSLMRLAPVNTLHYPRPDWCGKFDLTGRGVVFVDEMTSVPPALSAPLMGLVLARRVGGFTLPKGVRAIGAANPPEQAANGYDLPPPLANRFGHIDWPKPSVNDHAAFMLRGENFLAERSVAADAAEREEERVLAAWAPAYAREVGFEVSFLHRFPNHKNRMPKLDDPKSGRAWPSDRSWEAATRAAASADVHGLNGSAKEEFIGAFIGQGVASEWFQFREQADMPDAGRVLDGLEKWKHEPKRMDRTLCLFSACAALVTPEKAEKRKDRVDAFWGLLGDYVGGKRDMDVCVMACRAMVTAGLHGTKESKVVLSAINPMLKGADITPGAL